MSPPSRRDRRDRRSRNVEDTTGTGRYPGYWVKEGYLPEAVEIPDIVIPSAEVSQALAVRLSGQPERPPPPAAQPLRAEIEIEQTLGDEDSIFAPRAEIAHTEATELRQGVPELPREPPLRDAPRAAPPERRRRRRERAAAASFDSAKQPPRPSSPASADRFAPAPRAQRPTHLPRPASTDGYREPLGLAPPADPEPWGALRTGELDLDSSTGEISLGLPVLPIDELDPAPLDLGPEHADRRRSAVSGGVALLLRTVLVGIVFLTAFAIGLVACVGAYLLVTGVLG